MKDYRLGERKLKDGRHIKHREVYDYDILYEFLLTLSSLH
jgi:hypothetical protein